MPADKTYSNPQTHSAT